MEVHNINKLPRVTVSRPRVDRTMATTQKRPRATTEDSKRALSCSSPPTPIKGSEQASQSIMLLQALRPGKEMEDSDEAENRVRFPEPVSVKDGGSDGVSDCLLHFGYFRDMHSEDVEANGIGATDAGLYYACTV
jgi:hypothetical protein